MKNNKNVGVRFKHSDSDLIYTVIKQDGSVITLSWKEGDKRL